MNWHEYSHLPDYLEALELKKLFQTTILKIEIEQHCGPEQTNALKELANRQWHTYEYLDPEIMSQLEKQLLCYLDLNDYEQVKNIILISAYLGLVPVYQAMKDALPRITNLSIEELVKEAILELDESIADPYGGM